MTPGGRDSPAGGESSGMGYGRMFDGPRAPRMVGGEIERGKPGIASRTVFSNELRAWGIGGMPDQAGADRNPRLQ